MMAEERFMNLRPRVPWERDLGGIVGEEGRGGEREREREGGEVRVGRQEGRRARRSTDLGLGG